MLRWLAWGRLHIEGEHGMVKPGKVQAIAIMTLVGGIISVLLALGLALYVLLIGVSTCGVGFIALPLAIYPLIMGIMAILQGAKLLGTDAHTLAPPTTIAIMQIINIIVCDWINLTLGIITLVFLSEPEIKGYFQGKS